MGFFEPETSRVDGAVLGRVIPKLGRRETESPPGPGAGGADAHRAGVVEIALFSGEQHPFERRVVRGLLAGASEGVLGRDSSHVEELVVVESAVGRLEVARDDETAFVAHDARRDGRSLEEFDLVRVEARLLAEFAGARLGVGLAVLDDARREFEAVLALYVGRNCSTQTRSDPSTATTTTASGSSAQ